MPAQALSANESSITIEALEEIEERRQNWTKPAYKAQTGILKKFIDTVATASEGCVTT